MWDMILRCGHLNIVMTEIGLVPIVGVHAKSNPDGKKGRQAGTFDPKTVDLEDIDVTLPDGTATVVHLAARNGWHSVKEITETSEPHYEHLAFTRIQRRKDKSGFRFYGSFRLPEELGGGEFSIRLFQNDDDEAPKINRAENLRPIPEGRSTLTG